MPKKNTQKAALTLARSLAVKLVNEAPFPMIGDVNDSDCISHVAHVLDATVEPKADALVEEIKKHDPDLARQVSDYIGNATMNSQDAGYIFGLAVGQRVRVPALDPIGGGK